MAIPRRSLPVSDFFRHGSLVFGSTILANGFNYVFHFSISRILGVDGYGALSSMIALLTIVSVPAAVAATLIAKYSAEYWSSDSFGQMRTLSARLMRTLLILVAAGTAIALLSTGALLSYLHIANRMALAIFSFVIGVNLALPLLRGALQGIQDFRSFAISFAVESACKAGLGIAFAAAGFGLAGAIAGYAIGMGVSLLVTVWLLRQRIGPGPKAPLDLRASQVGSRTLWVALSTAALTSMGFIDILLVKHFFTPDDAGVYGIVALIGKVLFFVVSFVPAVVLPKATELAVRSLPTRRLFLEASLTIAAMSVV
jgi:O-antigen/teichoic acid export membrane protein